MREFLDAIFDAKLGHEYVELRVLGRDVPPYQVYESDLDAIQDHADHWAPKRDVYYGVLPRGAKQGDGLSIRNTTAVLWGDYDPKVMAKRDLFTVLTKLSPPPQIVVDSGSGYHVYWLLEQEVDFDAARMVMNEIAAQTGGDHVSDKARILRVPGTLNHKTNPPKPVRLLRMDLMHRGYKLSDFSDYFDNRDDGTVQSSFEDTFGEPQRRKGMVPRGIPTWLAALIETDPGHGARSEHAFHVAACLAEIGQTDEEIEVIFQANPQGVGAKYAEKGDRGHQWLMTTLRSVRSRV